MKKSTRSENCRKSLNSIGLSSLLVIFVVQRRNLGTFMNMVEDLEPGKTHIEDVKKIMHI